MPTRNVVLSEHQHDFVEALVQSGRYQNASEVLHEGLPLIEQRETTRDVQAQSASGGADKGWVDIAEGRYADLANDQIEDFVCKLRQQAARRSQTPGWWSANGYPQHRG